MEHVVIAIAVRGVVLRREALAAGIDDNALHRLVRGKVLVRLRHGAYAVKQVYDGADERERHLMLVEAVARLYGPDVVLSHSSAALIHGAPTWGLDLSSVHLTHFDGGGRRGARVVHHHGSCRVGDVTRVDGRWVTSPSRTIFDTTCIAGAEAGLVLADDLLHRGLTTKDELWAGETTRQMWPNSLVMNPVLHLADPRHESVGESRCCYLFWGWGLPAPIPQYEIRDADGRLLGRADFALPEHRLIIEFDGRVKYTALRSAGESIEDVVLREKRREERIVEATGWRVIRLTWSDLEHPERTAARIRRLLRGAA